MIRTLVGGAALAVLALISIPAAADPCQQVVDDVVNTATSDVLREAIKDSPELQKLSEEELVMLGGKRLLDSDRGDFKARAWMMLLWYGGKEGREIVIESGPTLETEEDRAHLYFVMALWQLRADDAETAAKGRDLLSQVRDTGKVTFAPDEMWTLFLEECDLPE